MKLTRRAAVAAMLLVFATGAFAQEPAAEKPGDQQAPTEQQAEDYIASAKALAQQGKHAEVIAVLDEAEQEGIQHAELFTLKGQSHQATGDPAEAVTAFTQALAMNPNYAPALVGRARLWLQGSQFDNAISDATRLIDTGVPAYEIRADAQLRRAESLLAKGVEAQLASKDLGGALRDYSALIEDRTRQGQTSLYAHDKRGQILMNLRAYDLAIAEYDRALAVEKHAWALANRARSLARLKRYDEAVTDFGNALDVESNAYVLLERAELYAYQGKQDAALADVAKAVEVAPDDQRIQANAKQAAKRIPAIAAEAKQEDADQRQGSSGNQDVSSEMAAIAARGDAAFAAKDYEKAMSDFNQLIEIGHPDGYRKRGVLLALAQRHADALGDFSKAIFQHGKSQPDLISMRAEQLFNLGAYDLALSEYERSYQLGVQLPGSRYQAAILYNKMGRYRDAIDAFTFEIEAGSENPFLWISRGVAYETLSEFDNAIADYKIAETKSVDGSQPQTIARNSVAQALRRKQLQETLTLIEHSDASGIVQLMDPLLQKFIDEESLGKRLNVIGQRFGKPLRASFMDLKLSDLRITGTLKFAKGEVDSEFVFDGRGKLVGFGLSADGFGLDTFDTLQHTEKLAEVAGKFWQLVYSGEGEPAYQMMVAAELQKSFPLEKFRRIFAPIEEKVKDVGIKSVALHSVRIHKPTQLDDRPSWDIYHLVELNNLQYNPARIKLELLDDDAAAGEFAPRSFDFQTGEFDDAYPVHDFSAEEKCFRAIATGDSEQVLNLIHPSKRSEINPAVLQAVLTALQEKLGPLESIAPDRFYALTEYDHAVRTTAGHGSVQFEKAMVPANCSHRFGWLQSFNIAADVSGWTRRIKDTAALEKRGEAFLLELINGDPQRAYSMLSAEFRETLTVAEIGKAKKACAERIGTAKSINFVAKENIEGTEDWKYEYKIVTDKLETKGSVTFDFDAFGGYVYAFNVSFNPIPDNDEQD